VRTTSITMATVGLLVLGAIQSLGWARSAVYVPGVDVVEWATADGRAGAHFSSLSDITPANVAGLEIVWTYRTGDWSTHENGKAGTAFESTPVMVDGRLFVITPMSRVIALDAETGVEKWSFDPGLDVSDDEHGMVTSRGLSLWKDPLRAASEFCAQRVVFASYDARLFTLDAQSGRPCPDFAHSGELDLRDGIERIEGRRTTFKHTSPPAIIGDLVVVGSTIYDSHVADAPSGKVRAFDLRTGECRWSWEPLVGIGGVLENGEAIAAGAANTWATITADEQNGLLFVPTSSPSPDHYGGLRPGNNEYANSLVALEAETGAVVWHFQMVHHDLWDYDLPAPPALVEIQREGDVIPVVVQATKTGHIFVFHRLTGEPFFPIDERSVPASDVPGEFASPTQPIPSRPVQLHPQRLEAEDAWGLTPWDRAACEKRIGGLRNDGLFTPPSVRGSIAYPGFIGGMEWGGVGYDPSTGILVTNTNRLAMVATLIPREIADTLPPVGAGAKFSIASQESTPYAVTREPLLSPLGIPCTPPPWGMLHAIDLASGDIVWERPFGMLQDLTKVPTPASWGSVNLGGPLITGGMVFIGASMDRRFRAFDLQTGELLWSDVLPASVQASPLTYRTRPGARQFVVVAAGGHDGMKSTLGDYVVAYALPLVVEQEGDR